VLLVTLLATTLVSAVDPPVSLAALDKRPKVQQEKVIPHTDVQPVHRSVPPSGGDGPRPATEWPSAGEAEVMLPLDAVPEGSRQADRGSQVAAPKRAHDLPVLLAATGNRGKGSAPARVRMADRAAAEQAGVSGVLFTVTAGSAFSASVTLDYSSFRFAGGADLGSRLRLAELPSCVLTTPGVAECRKQKRLPSRNDVAAQSVSVEAPLTGTPTVLATVADSSGPKGSFEASSLAPSGTWSVGGNAGAFSWAYPITVPPVAAGAAHAPKVALSYNSATVDGRTSQTNNQPSWVGQGWDYTPGYIERTYRGCFNDEALPKSQQTGDLCWAGQIVTMSLNGQSVELVLDDATQTWHASEDSGARVELVPGAGNGAFNGEHWKVTTTDGMQYWFGRNRWTADTSQEATNSTWTVPVYGPRPGNPCHNPAGFAQSSCAQAWRWNLDFAEDPHGNVRSYYYRTETNHYGANNGTAGVGYTRGGSLARIDYGLRKINGSIYGQTVPAQVLFGTIERCVPDAGFSCDPALFTAANARRWPDTPQDQLCLPGAVCNNHGPSFWSTKRLSTITTQYNVGSGPVVVDTYRLTQSFPSIGDPELRLDSIVRTGRDKDGSTITLPPTEFTSQLFDNRVPGYNSQPAMAHWRLTGIATDTGSSIAVTYSTPECSLADMPADPANNGRLCFPVYWTLPYNRDPILDYFHKYVTTQVEVQDRNALTPKQITSYSYLGAPAWHFDDNEVVKPRHRTYGQFRGYQQIEVRTGTQPDHRTLVRTTYFRGMDGDVLPGGHSRAASVPDSLGGTVPDVDGYAGNVREVLTFNGDGGTRLSSEISNYVLVATTGTRAREGLRPLTAEVIDTRESTTRTALAAGGERSASVKHRYDSLGRKTATTTSGTGVPDVCVTVRYGDNTTSWIRDRVVEMITSQQICPAEGVDPAPVLAAERTYYDSSATFGAIPGPGYPTRSDKANGVASGKPVYVTVGTAEHDAMGRPKSGTDPLNNKTTTAYTPAVGGIISKTVVTNAKNQTTVTETEPSRGLTTALIDVGGRRTDATYDQVGRLTAVWEPEHVKGQGPASTTHTYLQRTDGPLAVTTKKLVDHGTATAYVTSISLFDGLGQLIQTQSDDVSTPDSTTGRVVTDTFYDSHGWAVRTNNRYTVNGIPATTLVAVADSDVDDRTVTIHDGAGRPIEVKAYRGLGETRKTRMVHGGDRVTTFPPLGGVISTTITDVRGKNTELRQYTSPPTVSNDVVSGGEFQTNAYRYNALQQMDQMTDPGGNVWSFTYDMLGRQSTAADPDSGTRVSTYDAAGRLATSKDANGRVIAYDYDQLGRKVAEYSGSTSGTKLASWNYDTAPLGVGKLAYSARHTPAGDYMVGVSRYNSAGRPTDQMISIPDSETGLAGIHKTYFTYTTTGLIRSVEPVAKGGLPGETITFEYDVHGNPKSTAGYNSYVSASTYSPYGEASQYTLGVNNNVGWLTYRRDPQTRRITGTNLSVQKGWPQVDDLDYTYDLAGNVTRIVNVQGQPEDNAPTRTQCFGYDALARLTEAWTATDNCAAGTPNPKVGGVSPYWTSWSLDSIGRRLTQVKHALPGVPGGDITTTYNYPAAGAGQPHRLDSTRTSGPTGITTTNYTYDQAGNTKTRVLPGGNQTLDWNENNRLAKIAGPAGDTTYVYDADGNQIIRRDPGKATLYLPGEEIVRDTASGTLTGTRYYTHNGTTVALRVGGANPQYLQSDTHGTTQVAVSAFDFAVTRRDFEPYGNPIGSGLGTWPDSHGFLNKPHNPATGLTDIGARKYDPVAGRFISVDPVLDPADPGQWNPYAYANNSPVTNSDPTGLYCSGPDGKGCKMDDDVARWMDMPVTKPSGGGRGGGGVSPPRYPKEIREEITKASPKQRRGVLEGHFNTYSAAPDRPPWYEEFKAAFCYEFPDNGHCIGPTVEGAIEVAVLFLPWGRVAKGVAEVLGVRIASRAATPELGGAVATGGSIAGDAVGVAGAARIAGAGCSFVPGTQVLLADGSFRPIEELRPGDMVLATDPETGETAPRAVVEPLSGMGIKNMVQVTVAGVDGDQTGTLVVTANHPFWSPELRDWVPAGRLETGNLLQTSAGVKVQVSAVRVSASPQSVHNLEVDEFRTYYVLAGYAPVLVHNCTRVLSSSYAAADNRAVMNRFGADGFTGVYDPASGRVHAALSGGDMAVVSRQGGHGAINDAVFHGSRETVGFVAILQEGKIHMRWNSISVNVRNHGSRAAPDQFRQDIVDQMRAMTGLEVVG
jgi:RHS repeat-associated protein